MFGAWDMQTFVQSYRDIIEQILLVSLNCRQIFDGFFSGEEPAGVIFPSFFREKDKNKLHI